VNIVGSDDYFSQWTDSEAIATRMLPILNELRLDRGVLVHVYGRSIANVSSLDILKAHRHSRLALGRELTVQESYPVLQAVGRLNLGPCRLDLGKLTARCQTRANPQRSIDAFVREVLAEANVGVQPVLAAPQDIVLYGFGRIGRLLGRILVEKTGRGDKIRLRAAVVRPGGADDLKKRSALLRLDSVHGPFSGTIVLDEEQNAIVANGNLIRILYAEGPDSIDYTRYGIRDAIVVDNSGRWRDREGLGRHFKAPGVRQVLLSAPGKGDIPNIVYGINEGSLSPDEPIVSAASCTTNAIVPVLKLLLDRFGIATGHVETVHAYTNDQNLIDNYHKAARRGRAAALNMVLTETGAARAVVRVLPELAGKLTGNAIRVPTPDVSLAILKLTLETATGREELNEFLRDIAINGALRDQIGYSDSPDVVSSDLIGSRHAGVVDGVATIVNPTDGRQIVLYVWYDNEFGYACQVMRILQKMAGITLTELP
jgi:glyceraldehyde 3-phosphate dehydrogenase